MTFSLLHGRFLQLCLLETDGTGSQEASPEWYPIEVNQFFGGWQLCAELDLHGELVVYDLEQQAELARTLETTVASMLTNQDWLNAGNLAQGAVNARGPEEIWERDSQQAEMDDVPF